jgi:hypothetical protein
MRRRWIRVRPERRDDVGALLAAGVVAAGLGAVTFYVSRLFLAREPVDSHRPQDSESGHRDVEAARG